MPIHIDEMTTEVTAIDGDMPLSEAQVERLVTRVLERLEDRRRGERQARAATRLRSRAAPAFEVEE